MGAIASQITSLTIVYSTVYSDADQRKHQSSASLAFVWGIHRGPVNSPHKWPVTRKMFPFDDVIMLYVAVKLICVMWLEKHSIDTPPSLHDLHNTTFPRLQYTKEICKRSFAYKGSMLSNDLPDEVKESSSTLDKDSPHILCNSYLLFCTWHVLNQLILYHCNLYIFYLFMFAYRCLPNGSVTGQNVDKPKSRQPKRRQTKTSKNRNVERPKRRQTKSSTNRNVDKPERQQTETSTNLNIDRPKRRQTKTSTGQNVDTPKRRQT